MMNENMIENVREYLNEHNDVAIECLEHLGDYDWLTIYSLDDLLDDYCNGELEEVINLFVSSGTEARSYYEYYVKDGEVYDADDLYYDVESVLGDDDVITEIIAEIDYRNINVPDELYNMCRTVTLEDVQGNIRDSLDFVLYNNFEQMKLIEDLDCFKTSCESVAILMRIVNALTTIVKSCNEDDYPVLQEVVWEHTIPSIMQFAIGFAKGGVTIEKAVEVWMKKNLLEG